MEGLVNRRALLAEMQTTPTHRPHLLTILSVEPFSGWATREICVVLRLSVNLAVEIALNAVEDSPAGRLTTGSTNAEYRSLGHRSSSTLRDVMI